MGAIGGAAEKDGTALGTRSERPTAVAADRFQEGEKVHRYAAKHIQKASPANVASGFRAPQGQQLRPPL